MKPFGPKMPMSATDTDPGIAPPAAESPAPATMKVPAKYAGTAEEGDTITLKTRVVRCAPDGSCDVEIVSGSSDSEAKLDAVESDVARQMEG